MPEYLAPDVYVEEIDTGSKPIEGVSTSTAAMVGVTERGPVNVPILVTSYGEFVRWFGETLDEGAFKQHRFLPHAVEGFFTNGGKRLFIVRVLDSTALFAATMLFDRTSVAGASTSLLAPVGTVPPTAVIYVANDAGLNPPTAPPTWIQIGDGSNAEFLQVIGPVPARTDVVLRRALSFPHLTTATVDHITQATVAGTAVVNTPTLDLDVTPGAKVITVTGAGAIAAGTVLRLGTSPTDDEYVISDGTVSAAPPAQRTVGLQTPVQIAHKGGGGATIDIFAAASFPNPVPIADHTTLSAPTVPGASVLLVANRAPFVTAQDFVRVNDGVQTEIRRIGVLSSIALPTAAYSEYPAGSVVEAVTIATGPAINLTQDATAGSNVISIDNRTSLNPGEVLQIGLLVDPQRELVVIQDLPNHQGGLDPGMVVLATPLQHGKVAPSQISRVTPPINPTAVPGTVITSPTARGASSLLLSGGNLFTAPAVLRISVGTAAYYHVMPAAPAAINASPLTLSGNLDLPHVAGEPVIARTPLLGVRALDQGEWGDRLRVAVSDNDPPLARTQIRGTPPDSFHLKLKSANGVEAGTILKRVNAAGVVQSIHKVAEVDRQKDFLIRLETTTPLPGAAADLDPIVSHEFQLDVFLMQQPDPAVPSRSENVLMSESFPYLSLDPSHSRYIHKVVGTTWTPGAPADDDAPPNPLRKSDRRSEGASWLVRVHDVETVAANKLAPRLGPAPLVDVMPSGRPRPARLRLVQGDDAVGLIGDITYIGQPNPEPELRTGIFAFENEEDVSIVAVPGQTGQAVQGALIAHCENMRYRFAVLDGPPPPADSLNDAQVQRQLFDTKYAAFYHPWLLIPDPYPPSLANVAAYAIPPSGHMVGIYARTDIERGVHKAPANEVVRGIIGLQRRLNKSEHDLLNPSPVNINVIRDFREQSRGIRVYGGRVITSDPDWKYVNVRRLLIFIEASINRGLQWVVFEPNAEPLWARVRRSISNFLTLVWRNGALEGTKVEEAYFVKCDRTTMTQTDIDNGRLICVVGVAPVKPAEFVIVRIGLWTAHADD
jgi:phage tail sheath protein FI